MKRFESIAFIITAFIIAALASCVRDLDGGKEKSDVDGTALVTLSLTMPTAPASRAMTEVQENAVTAIDVLLFAIGDDKLYYRAAGTSISSITTSTKQFNVRLPVGTYNVVVLANATTLLAGSPHSTLLGGTPPVTTATGDSRATVLAGLVANTITDGAIPMWGYKNGLIIDESTPSPAASIDLTRAIARVDVSLDGGVTNFELKSVYLYNRYSAGSVTPAASSASGNVDGYDGNQWKDASGEKKAAAPNIPSAASKVTGPEIYVVPAGQERAFTRSIYAFEAPAGNPVTGSNWETNTCLVVGGLHDDGVNTPYLTYYRVEFRSGDGNANPYTYLALLRNHLYNVVIQEVSAPGWPTFEDAYANLPSNIIVQIEAWNDGGMSEVLFDGQHSLTVNKSRLEFYVEGYAKSMTVSTTYPDGWTVEDLPAWLEEVSIVPPAAGGMQSTLTLQVKAEDPLTTSSRSGEFYIVAGNLRKKITVAQSDEIEFWITITDPVSGQPLSELFFEAGNASTAPVEREFRVTWLPSSRPLDVSKVPGTNPFAYGSGEDFSMTPYTADLNGGYTFTVQPPYNEDPVTRVTRVDFSVTLADGQSRMQPLYLRQTPGPTYAFSPDGTILTLFENFPRDTDLAGLNSTNIPELQAPAIAAAVTTLVIEGDITEDQVSGIKNARDPQNNTGLLPYLAHVSLPDFTKTIPDHAFPNAFDLDDSTTNWLKSFSAPRAIGIGYAAFAVCTLLSTVDMLAVVTIGRSAFQDIGSLETFNFPVLKTIDIGGFSRAIAKEDIYFPAAETIGISALSYNNIVTVDLPAARTIGRYAFMICSSLTTLKLGYDGEIDVPLEGTNTDTLFGYNRPNRSNTIDLYLGAYEYAAANVGNKTWKNYTWKSINPYVPVP